MLLRRPRIFLLFVLLFGGAVAGAQDTRPALTQPAIDSGVTQLIHQLNDADPQVREQATKALWSRGSSVEPALRLAAEDGPPEVVRRAKSILRDFTYGLYPDTPKEIFEDLKQYRAGDLGQKQSALWMLNSRGIPGLRVLLHLRDEERSPEMKLALDRVLDTRWRDVAVLLLTEDKVDQARQVIEKALAAASTASAAGQDYAALLATTGKPSEKLDQLKNQPITAKDAVLRLALARAAGDLPGARSAAEKVKDVQPAPYPQTLDSVLIEQGDWPALARRLQAGAQGLEPPERLGYLCAYYRLTGDEENYQKTAEKLATLAEEAPQNYAFCAKDLFLNSLPEQAEAILLNHNDYLEASSFLAARLEVKKALELPDLARRNQPGKLLDVQARTAEALHFAGDIAKAKQLLEEASQENRLRNDLATWASLIEAAQQLGQAALAEEFCATALTRGGIL